MLYLSLLEEEREGKTQYVVNRPIGEGNNVRNGTGGTCAYKRKQDKKGAPEFNDLHLNFSFFSSSLSM